jgi:hypothetical protein
MTDRHKVLLFHAIHGSLRASQSLGEGSLFGNLLFPSCLLLDVWEAS